MDMERKIEEKINHLTDKAADIASDAKNELQQNAIKLVAEGQALASQAKVHAGATVKDVAGHVQEVVGKATDNPALATEGLARQAEAELEHDLANE